MYFKERDDLEISIFLGFFVGYLVANVFSRLFISRTEKQAITMAQIQSLRLFSKSVEHYGHLRQWHDNVAIALDDLRDKILARAKQTPSLSETEVAELSKFWDGLYREELKSVWNEFEYDMKSFKDASVQLISSTSQPYSEPPYSNWKEAMQWLMMFEMVAAQKLKEQMNSEEEKNE